MESAFQPLGSQLMTPVETVMPESHPLRTLESVVLVAIGGFSGSNFRYFVDTLLAGPGATLAVNVVGSFVLGFILYEAIYTGILAERMQLVFATGFLSSLTTYSTFGIQTALLGSPLAMAGNIVVTYVLGFFGVFAGRALAKRIERDAESSGVEERGVGE